MKAVNFLVGGAIGLIVFFVLIFGFQPQTTFSNSDFLRIHIRANSNSEIDQRVKYQVKNEIVDFLTPHLVQATDKQSAMAIVQSNLSGVEKVADKVLKDNGFDYVSKALIRKENFPTRQYDDVTLQSGVYDALILNLGSGAGNNWWCVVYPPLCFVGGADDGSANITYRSKIVELINDFFKK